MADANEEKKLVIQVKDGEDIVYKYGDMNDGQQVLFMKAELINKDLQELKSQSEYKMEQLQILSNHYAVTLQNSLQEKEYQFENGEKYETKDESATKTQ